jgi:hypothetical protein
MGCVMFELEKAPGGSNGYWCRVRCFDKLSMTDRGRGHEKRRRYYGRALINDAARYLNYRHRALQFGGAGTPTTPRFYQTKPN